MPKVSVVMSVLNGETYLAESIKSILLQPFEDIDFLVVNDGSTDRTGKILSGVQDARLRVIDQDNRGLAASLNRAVSEATGDYIARMDADDFSYPNRLLNQTAFLDENPAYGLVGSYYHLIGPTGQLLGLQYRPVDDAELQRYLLEANQFAHGAVMFRRSLFEQVGGYDVQFRYAQDYDLWLRMAERSKLFNLPKVLYAWRSTAENQSAEKVSEQLRIAGEIQERAKQRRASGNGRLATVGKMEGAESLNGNGGPPVSQVQPCVLFTDAANPMSYRLAGHFRSTFDRDAGCDLVYARSDSAPPQLIATKKRHGARVIHNLAGILFPAIDARYTQSNTGLKQIQDELADFVIYQSDFTRRACEEFIGPPPCPWEIVPNAVDENLFSPPKQRERQNVLLAVGLHRHTQRMGAMLNALSIVRETVPDVRLLIAGPIRSEGLGAVLDLMNERITTLGLSDCVEVLGQVPQERLPDLYRSANVFLHPASIDWCPKVVIEAMACGLPVAYALHGGTPELVEDAGVGVPVDAPSWERMPEIDHAEYAGAILKILEREEEFSQKARERVLERYTLGRSTETHKRIFEKVLSSPPHKAKTIQPKHPIFHQQFNPVPIMWVEFDGEQMSYPRAFITDFTKRVAPIFTGRVLDMGAGNWTLLRDLFSHCEYYTVDMLAVENTDIVADLLDIPVPDQSLDGIICHQVLEHVTDPARVVRELYRVLRPGGRLLLSTPFLYPIHEDGPVKDYFRYTERGLRELLKNFQEVDVDCVGPPNFPFVYCILGRK
jgi:glycosyltransferase involved in cell wall biosynthesis